MVYWFITKVKWQEEASSARSQSRGPKYRKHQPILWREEVSAGWPDAEESRESARMCMMRPGISSTTSSASWSRTRLCSARTRSGRPSPQWMSSTPSREAAALSTDTVYDLTLHFSKFKFTVVTIHANLCSISRPYPPVPSTFIHK